MNDCDLDDLIAGYIRRHSQPIHWIKWCLDAPDPGASAGLSAVLHDPETGSLRDLTEPAVREGVIRAVLASEPLTRAVGEEVDRFLEDVAQGLVDRFDQPDGR